VQARRRACQHRCRPGIRLSALWRAPEPVHAARRAGRRNCATRSGPADHEFPEATLHQRVR